MLVVSEPLLPEPEQPADWECCGSDCGEACIWEMYYRDKRLYDEQQRQLKEQQKAES